jgi:plastocyanin
MLYVLAVRTGLLVLVPVITCAAAEPFAFEVPLDPDGIQRTVVEADSYEFIPRHLVVRAGKPVELTVKSVTVLVPHNFLIDDPKSGLAIREEISAGKTVKITFTPTVPGSFAIYCDKKLLFFKSHREKGMEGVLEVRP